MTRQRLRAVSFLMLYVFGLETTALAYVRPILLGASRKSFLREITGVEVAHDRLAGSLAVAALAADGRIDILRVHDVAETVQVVRTVEAIRGARTQAETET